MKLKRILMRILTVTFAISMLFLVACNKAEDPKVIFREQNVVYRVGESIDLKDLIEVNENLTYSFNYSFGGGETVAVESRTLFAVQAGDYEIECTATNKEGKSASDSTTITVYEHEPLLFMENTTYSFKYLAKYYLEDVIPDHDIKYISETEIEFEIKYCYFYKNPYVKEGEKIEFNGTPASGELAEIYNGGDSITFAREGMYEFHFVLKNAGGEAQGSFNATVKEDFSKYVNVETKGDYDLDYNAADRTISWTPFEGASKYKVKVDYETAYTSQTSLELTDYLVQDFQLFDLVVVPLDSEGDPFVNQGETVTGYKYEIKNFVISPSACGPAILSSGTTVTEEDGVYTAYMLGGKVRSRGWNTGMHLFKNNYVAWLDDYGIGTYVDFTFKGNNMPQVMFFGQNPDDKVSYFSDMSTGNESKPNKGVLLLNGVYCATVDTTYELFSADRITVWGPERFRGTSGSLSVTWSGKDPESGIDYRIANVTDYQAFTQNYLMEHPDTEYKYIVGTYEKDGKLWINMVLIDLAKNVEVQVAHIKTSLDANKVVAGNIAAYASVKIDAEDSQFTFSKPYEREPYYEEVGAYKGTINKTTATTGSVVLDGVRPVHAGNGSGVGATSRIGVQDSYVAFKGEYGAGNYVEFTYSGNNMPYVMFYADEIDGYLGNNAANGKGLILIHGIVDNSNQTAETMEREVICDKLTVWGPNRYGGDKDGAGTTKPLLTLTYEDYPLLTQKGLKEDTSGTTYRYKVGTYYDAIGNFILDIKLYNNKTNATIYDIQQIVPRDAAKALEAGNVIAYGTMKGLGNPTTFTYKAPVLEKPDTETTVVASLATPNADGSVTLEAVPYKNNYLGTHKITQNSYVGFDADYELNTYIDLYYTGDNLPYITFFANVIDGILNSYDKGGSSDGNANDGTGHNRAGITLMSGGRTYEGGNANYNTAGRMFVFGPYRYDDYFYKTHTAHDELKHGTIVDNRQYKLTVGVVETSSGGNIGIDVTLSYLNGSTYTQLYSGVLSTYNTTVAKMKTVLGLSETDELKGKIILHGAIKGADNDTTFKFSQPYQKTNQGGNA